MKTQKKNIKQKLIFKRKYLPTRNCDRKKYYQKKPLLRKDKKDLQLFKISIFYAHINHKVTTTAKIK
jgi:hypothetical protein